MKAITIHQPYAHLIAGKELPVGMVRKRVENRTWSLRYTGPILIHAGKSRQRLNDYAEFRSYPMEFGKLIGVANLVACLEVQRTEQGVVVPGKGRFDWIEQHPHTEGPYAFVLEDVRYFEWPMAVIGQQGVWDCKLTEVIRGAIDAARPV